MRDFTDFYFEFEDRVARGEYNKEQANIIFREACESYFLEETNIEIPREDPAGFSFYVKLLNTDMYPRKKFKLLAKKVVSVTDSSLSYTGSKDPVRYWVGPFETQKEAIQTAKTLITSGIKAKVEKWTPKMIQDALIKEEKDKRDEEIKAISANNNSDTDK